MLRWRKEIPLEQRIGSILDLRDGRCRWPVDDLRKATVFFCGEKADGPYRRHHADVARQLPCWLAGAAE